MKNFVEISDKLLVLAFQYDECFKKASDELLSIDERRCAFMDSAKIIGMIVELYRDTRSLYPDCVRITLDDKLSECDEETDDRLLKLIVFVQSFNEELSKLSENKTFVTKESSQYTPFVFISYSRTDIEQASAICELLNKNGISYWIDKEGKYSGRNFKGVIVEQIKKSNIVLFLSSQSSNQSSNVIKEIGISVYYQKPIIPIKLDSCSYDVNIEYDLCNIDYIEYNLDKSFTIRLIDSIKVHL